MSLKNNGKDKLLQFYTECSPDKYFKCIDGATLKSIGEFVESLHWMSDDVFYYHVSDKRNDFASWIEAVFDNKELAALIKHSRTKEKTQIALLSKMLAIVLGR